MGARSLKSPPAPPGLDTYRGRLMAHGMDTFAESWNVVIRAGAWAAIQEARIAAEEADQRGQYPALATICGREFQVMPFGAAGGVKYVLRDPRVIINLRAQSCDWGVTVRYLSAGLWNNGGLEERRREVAEWIAEAADIRAGDDGEPIISRFDYAFDFHAPDMTAEATEAMRARFLAPAHTKWNVWGEGSRTQTFTLGMMPRLQVQLYDKGAEIVQASGKDWMRDVWAQSADGRWGKGGAPAVVSAAELRNAWTASGAPITDAEGKVRDVWRVELRFGGEWLKERGLRGWPAIHARLPELLSCALVDRRLTENDPRRLDLRPMHPLWWLAWHAAGAATTAPRVTAYTSLQKSEYREMMITQLAGTLRSVSVSQTGIWNAAEAFAISEAARRRAETDPEAALKVVRARARFRHLGRMH